MLHVFFKNGHPKTPQVLSLVPWDAKVRLEDIILASFSCFFA